MTRFAILSVALVLGVPAAARDQAQSPPESGTGNSDAKLESLLENCDAHKFETMVDSVVGGQPHRSKVKMCGKEGQSDADWIAGNARLSSIPAIRSPADTEKFMREQYELYEKLAVSLGIPTQQIVQAALLYAQVRAENPTANITFTGHSLGGGIASIMTAASAT